MLIFAQFGAGRIGAIHAANLAAAGATELRYVVDVNAAAATALAAFVDALVRKKPMPASAADGRQAIVLAEAAVKSLRTGRAVKVGR